MFCSSGLSKLPNGRPYSIPTRRSAAASARIAATAALYLCRRSATDEVGDARAADEHRVDSCALERDDVVTGRGLKIGDRELAGGDVGEQVEDPLEVLLVVLRLT